MMPLFFLEKKLGLFKSKKGSHFSITSFSVPLEFVFSNQFIIDLKRLSALALKFKENKKT